MSTRATIYKHANEDGVEIHVFEELGYNTEGGPGFYVHLFVPWAFDVVIPISKEIADEIRKKEVLA